MRSNVRNLGRLTEGEIRRGMGAAPAVALTNPKYGHNVGAALRSCAALGARQLWVTGTRATAEWEERGRLPREERMKSYGGVEVFLGDYFFEAFETDVEVVAVEIVRNATPLTYFEHPEKALYVFGPEDGSLGKVARQHARHFVIIPTDHCLNLVAAVTSVLLDRRMKRQLAGLEEVRPSYETLEEQRGFIEREGS